MGGHPYGDCDQNLTDDVDAWYIMVTHAKIWCGSIKSFRQDLMTNKGCRVATPMKVAVN